MTQLEIAATDANPLGLPERVLVLSLWWRWAAAVAAGIKTIETRTWPWPYGPGWLAIHAAKREDGPIEGERIPWTALSAIPPVDPGALCALVYVADCRPIVRADQGAALIYRPGLYAWCLEPASTMRLRPVKMRGPQKFSSVDREIIYAALQPYEAAT